VGNASTGLTTASFNTPTASYLVAMVSCDNTGGAATGSVTDSKGNSWTLLKRSNVNSSPAEVWGLFVQQPQTGMTVSCTFTNGANMSTDSMLNVQVLAGASASQPGTTNSASGTVDTIAIVPKGIGSMIFGMLGKGTGNISYAANAQSTTLALNADAASGSTQWAFRSKVVTSSLASVTYGSSTAAAVTVDIVAVEILASNGLSNNYQFGQVGDGMSVSEKIR